MKNLAAILIFISLPAWAWQGQVVGIADGDTLTALDESNRPVKIRLVEIDAPEKRQPFGTRSKQALSDMCYRQVAQIEERGKDRYGRTLGKVTCGGIEANAEQVRRGMAWAYLKYQTDRVYSQYEADARAQKQGLWQDQNPIPPWEFRHNGRKQ